MGCSSSKSAFSAVHQECVKRTWEAFTTAENADKGVAWFVCVFENHPNLRETWGDDNHELLVQTVCTIEVIVANVNKLSSIVDTIDVLGPVRADSTGDIDSLQAVINTILIALETGLEDQFVDDVKIGWTYVFDILKASMVRRIENANKDTKSLPGGDAVSAEGERAETPAAPEGGGDTKSPAPPAEA